MAIGRKIGKQDGLTGDLRRARKNANLDVSSDTSDGALLALLDRLKAASDPAEVRLLTDQLEGLVFHKQFENA